MTTPGLRAAFPPAVAAVLLLGPTPVSGEDAAWSHLAAVRSALASASPLAANFVQSYTPSGFSVADEESGVLAMRLVGSGSDPTEECIRWDYTEPFPKGFLLCDRIAWTWNPGEESGRRHVVASSDTFGLDLLRLSVDQLRLSYDADVAARDGGRVEVRLVPTGGAAAAEIRDASLELDSESRRLLSLSYHDVEGNLTRFTLGDYRSIDRPETLFTPPADLLWLDE